MTWIVFPCRKCGTIQIAKRPQAVKKCVNCHLAMTIYVATTVSEKHVETHDGLVRKGIVKPTAIPRVKIYGEFATFAEASDAARWAKLPGELKDPARTELYQSSAWRKTT